MRIIAGSARGTTLRVPKTAPTRPTADLVKGVVFSMLEAEAYKRGFEPDDEGAMASAIAWPRVLDLFAGSGALGIEALSRGAIHATFVEQNADALRAIRSNLEAAQFTDRGTILQTSAERGLSRVKGPVDLVLLDPPYEADESLAATLGALGASDLLAPSSVVILEQASSAEPPSSVGPLPLKRTKSHGRTRVSMYGSDTHPE